MTAPTGTAYTIDRNPAGTAHSISASLTTLAIALAFAGLPIQVPIRHSRTPTGNVSVTIQEWDMSRAILSAISALHDRLLARSRALPTEAARVLFSNLWTLYVD
jgi:hypothetical protein